MMGRGMMAMMKMMGTDPAGGHIEGRLAYARAKIKIADNQTTQWNAFADAVRANFKSMTDMRQPMMSGQGTATTLPQRFALEDEAATAHLGGGVKKVEESLDKLYVVLSDDQKKLVDGIVIGPMGILMGMV